MGFNIKDVPEWAWNIIGGIGQEIARPEQQQRKSFGDAANLGTRNAIAANFDAMGPGIMGAVGSPIPQPNIPNLYKSNPQAGGFDYGKLPGSGDPMFLGVKNPGALVGQASKMPGGSLLGGSGFGDYKPLGAAAGGDGFTGGSGTDNNTGDPLFPNKFAQDKLLRDYMKQNGYEIGADIPLPGFLHNLGLPLEIVARLAAAYVGIPIPVVDKVFGTAKAELAEGPPPPFGTGGTFGGGGGGRGSGYGPFAGENREDWHRPSTFGFNPYGEKPRFGTVTSTVGNAYPPGADQGFQAAPGQVHQVPGPPDQPVPAIVHGGELIGRPLPGQPMAPSPPVQNGGGMPNIIINVGGTPQPAAPPAEAAPSPIPPPATPTQPPSMPTPSGGSGVGVGAAKPGGSPDMGMGASGSLTSSGKKPVLPQPNAAASPMTPKATIPNYGAPLPQQGQGGGLSGSKDETYLSAVSLLGHLGGF